MTGLISEQVFGGTGSILDTPAAPALPASYATLTAAELEDFIEAVIEADAGLREPAALANGPEPYRREPDEVVQCPNCGLYDAPDAVFCDQCGQPLPPSAFADLSVPAAAFSDAFSARASAEQARSDAREAAAAEDLLRPARRDEDKMARAARRAAAGVYDTGQQPLSFAAESAAIELARASGRGPCGPLDAYGRCSSRYHQLECSHQHGVDWVAETGAPRTTYQAALSNASAALELSSGTLPVWDDTDADEDSAYPIPAATIELAHGLAADLFDDSPFSSETFYGDLLRPPAAPVTAYDAMAESIGAPLRDAPPAPQPGYPGVSDLAHQLGLK